MTVFLWENNIKIVRGMDKPNDALLNLKKINTYSNFQRKETQEYNKHGAITRKYRN